MEAFCKYNPEDNPYWCKIIWGYCQFQADSHINEHCPIYQGFPNWPIHVDGDVDDEFLQTHGYATIYDNGECLVSLGDTAFQRCQEALALRLPYVRYIGRYAFQDCINLQSLDFSECSEIPVLASAEAFMKQDGSGFVNDSFVVIVP